MKEMPTDDPLFGKGSIRVDGRKIHPAYLFEVKKPSRVQGPVGLLQAGRHHAGRPGVPAAVGKRVPAGQEVTLRVPAGVAAAGVSVYMTRLSERSIDAGPLRAASGGTDQRLVLRAVESRPCRDLRHAQHHQFRAWRALHDGRVLRLFPAQRPRHRLLVGADHRADRGRHFRHDPGADHAEMADRARSSLRPAADLRPRADHAGRVPELFRFLGPALRDPRSNSGRHESRLHVPADLSRLGRDVLAGGLHRHLVS